ncbi:MAG: DUF6015 family protein [Thermoplasmata archaeon]|jgi:hypothetical protein|nr:hypothetical protein [Thermoplasmatales archaeon]PMP75600.1 MAG: hypothetical protein C0180_00950 [Aciduliprofundum sp.]
MPIVTEIPPPEVQVITVPMLARAIVNGISGETKMNMEEALNIAQHILNFFGFEERIIDNYLEPDDRGLFYMLEEIRILIPEREETTLYDGREWRIHYWVINTRRVLELQVEKEEREKEFTEEDIYKEIPDEFWTRGVGE